jgi:hypothetical protein
MGSECEASLWYTTSFHALQTCNTFMICFADLQTANDAEKWRGQHEA